jgi:hypothetical protein
LQDQAREFSVSDGWIDGVLSFISAIWGETVAESDAVEEIGDEWARKSAVIIQNRRISNNTGFALLICFRYALPHRRKRARSGPQLARVVSFLVVKSRLAPDDKSRDAGVRRGFRVLWCAKLALPSVCGSA